MNRYIIKNILLTLILAGVGNYAWSQDIPIQKDSIDSTNEIPGRLFSTTLYNNTSATATASGETLYRTTTPNFTNTLSGQLSGLFINQANGEPGNDNAQWQIRGVGSYGRGYYNSAKIFVDGFEVTTDYLSYLTPAEIDHISVLKDAASLATLGMQGANGILWVETKRGHIGKPTVSLQLRSGIQQPINIHKPLDAYNFASLYNQAVSNDHGMKWTPAYSPDELNAYRNYTGTNVDWYNEVLKENGYYTDADFTFNGGNQNARYNVLLGYANQQGLYNVSNTDQTSNQRLSRYNIRANLDFKLFTIVDASVDLGARLEDRKQPNYWNTVNDLAAYPSNIYPVYDEKATEDEFKFSGTTLYPNNPVGSIKGLGWYSSRARTLQGNFRFNEKLDFITKGLYLQEAFSFYVRSLSTYSKTRNYARYFNGAPTTTDQTTSIVASSYGSAGMDQWMQGSITLGYANNFGKHAIHSALNLHLSDFKGDGLYEYKNRYVNYNGRINYSYDNRYVGEFGFSYFGSDAYAPGNCWGFYPSVSAAWIVSNESFLKTNDILSFLKVRGSVGKTGTSESNATDGLSNFYSNGRYLYQQYYYYTKPFYTGTSAPFTDTGSLTPLFIANSNTFAEQSMKYNLGLDVSLFKKINFTIDMFIDKRKDILTMDNALMHYYGTNHYLDNIGKMTNKGFEASISFSDRINKLKYSVYGMAFYAKNKIDYMAEVAPAHPYNAKTGQPYGTVIGLEAIGFYQPEDFNADGTLKNGLPIPLFGSVQPGDIRYKDLDENHFIDQTDVTKIGNPSYPKWNFSFGGNIHYEGFDFHVLFQGAAGASVNLLNHSTHFIAFVNNGNAYEIAKGAWAYYPEQNIDTRTTATYPRLTTQNNENNYQYSSFWMRNNNYLRIKNIEVGYDFCNKLIRNKNLSKFRVYVNAVNPITWSSLLKDYDLDPETGYGYPALKSFNFGINLTF